MIGAATYNVQDLYKSSEPGREQHVYQAIRALREDVDDLVLSVQEVVADHDGGHAALAQLAAASGLVAGPCARGHHIRDTGMYHWVGLLWSANVELVGNPQSFSGEMWHNLVAAPVRVDGHELFVGSYHGSPLNQRHNEDEALRLAHVWAFPQHRAGWIGGDFNALSADRVARPDDYGGTYWPLYDQMDPYRPRPDPKTGDYRDSWSAQHLFQTRWDYTTRGDRVWEGADRRAGDVLYAAGLRDVRAVLDVRAVATTGHHPDNPHGSCCIDRIHATGPVLPALEAVHVHDTPDARSASDHLPVLTLWDLHRLR